jgi:hypothetical protein
VCPFLVHFELKWQTQPSTQILQLSFAILLPQFELKLQMHGKKKVEIMFRVGRLLKM